MRVETQTRSEARSADTIGYGPAREPGQAINGSGACAGAAARRSNCQAGTQSGAMCQRLFSVGRGSLSAKASRRCAQRRLPWGSASGAPVFTAPAPARYWPSSTALQPSFSQPAACLEQQPAEAEAWSSEKSSAASSTQCCVAKNQKATRSSERKRWREALTAGNRAAEREKVNPVTSRPEPLVAVGRVCEKSLGMKADKAGRGRI